ARVAFFLSPHPPVLPLSRSPALPSPGPFASLRVPSRPFVFFHPFTSRHGRLRPTSGFHGLSRCGSPPRWRSAPRGLRELRGARAALPGGSPAPGEVCRSEEHTSELQSR